VVGPENIGEVDEIFKEPDTAEAEIRRKGSLRTHHYEDAMRIACGAWGETGQKRKTVTWEKRVPA